MAEHTTDIRVRYSEIDQLGTFYNARALEWFEVGRTELLRALGMPYPRMEARGVCLPLITAHVDYHHRAGYDERLRVATRLAAKGKARLRFDVVITHADEGHRVAAGYTIHAVTTAEGRPIRPPAWLTDLVKRGMED
ncbi:MAG: acyl-CoA thioesterase [Planctomycetota bacterium]